MGKLPFLKGHAPVPGRLLGAGLVLLCLAWGGDPAPAFRVVVLPVSLNDLSNQPASAALPERMAALGVALRERLATDCGYEVVSVDSLAGAEVTPGYLYAHPDVAVELAGAQADWVVIPRLNRASPWVTDLQAHVVRVRDTAVVSNRIVEVKGIEMQPDLAAKLVDRGGAWMADQVSQAIEHAAGPGSSPKRRCPA